MEPTMIDDVAELGAVPSIHITLRRPPDRYGCAASKIVLLVLCAQGRVVSLQTTSTMPSDNNSDPDVLDTDLPSYLCEDSDEDTPRQDWTPEASKF